MSIASARVTPTVLKLPMPYTTAAPTISKTLIVGWRKTRNPEGVVNIALADRAMLNNPLAEGIKTLTLDRGVDKVVTLDITNGATPSLYPCPVTKDANRVANGRLSRPVPSRKACRNSGRLAPAHPYATSAILSSTQGNPLKAALLTFTDKDTVEVRSVPVDMLPAFRVLLVPAIDIKVEIA